MGYTTEFRGRLATSRELTEVEKNYINLISSTRRMKRDVNKLMKLYDGKHGNPFATENTPEAIYGVDGEYFVGEDERDDSVLGINTPPGQLAHGESENYWVENLKRTNGGICQPGLWCQWIILPEEEADENADYLEWDGGEKFYNYIQWLCYLINHFFEKWGVELNGDIEWRGEEWEDNGTIHVEDNIVTIS